MNGCFFGKVIEARVKFKIREPKFKGSTIVVYKFWRVKRQKKSYGRNADNAIENNTFFPTQIF